MAVRVLKATKPDKVEAEPVKIRAAAYCRVSTDQDAQMTSYDNQVEMYTERIQSDPTLELFQIFTDAGISGTQVKNRAGFQEMLQAARKKQFDLLYVKSISRFARNTTDCLQYVRELRECGVRIIFEKENIDTGAAYSEMILTIMAAFAQEESRSISENVKQGIRMRYQDGHDRWVKIYGYEKTEQGTYQIVEEEAQIIRRVFAAYERGKSMAEIAQELNAEGAASSQRLGWKASSVHSILTNEKYMGDVQLQKKITVNHITHRQVKNNLSVVNGYYIDNHHTPIVTREQFERVAKIRQMRRQNGEVQYPFGTLLHCPYCKSALYQRKLPIQKGASAWCCDDCRGFILGSKLVERAMLAAASQKGIEEPSVEFWWLDEQVERIEFGMHMLMPKVEKQLRAKRGKIRDDRTMTVHWKDGTETTVSTGIARDSQMPMTLVSLYDAWLERNGKEQDAQDKR